MPESAPALPHAMRQRAPGLLPLTVYLFCALFLVAANLHGQRAFADSNAAPKSRDRIADPTEPARLAIVIDDVGYHLNRAQRLLALPGEVALGLLPYAPHTQRIARLAARQGRELILHQPMEPVTAGGREPGTLEADMPAERLAAELEAALQRLPQVRGVNNHTGSLLTSRPEPMEQVMLGIARHGLYFLDSRTTPLTVAESIARAHRVPALRRDVFLDHDPAPAAIVAAFEASLAIARARGQAVVIAHPYPVTIEFLERALIRLPPDIRLTTPGDLVQPRAYAGD